MRSEFEGGSSARGTFAACLIVSIAFPISGCAFGDREPRPNVLLISVDTLRADRVNSYGYQRRVTSPAIDALAAEGVLFENHIVASPWTTPSQMSLMTSLTPSAHGMTQSFDALVRGVEGDGEFFRLPAERVTLAERLRAGGYRTAAFTGGGTVDPALGFDQGFDRYDTSMYKLSDSRLEGLLSFISESDPAPFFAFWHTFEVHAPYLQGEFLNEVMSEDAARSMESSLRLMREGSQAGTLAMPERQRMITDLARLLERRGAMKREVTEALYDGGIRSFDRYLEIVIARLRESGSYDRTWIILTSDHGEEFADHSTQFYDAHGHSVYDELVRVPLIMKLPNSDYAGTRVHTVVRNIDVMPTLLVGLGLSSDSGSDGGDIKVQGEALQSIWENPASAAGRSAITEALTVASEAKSLRTDRYKYVVLVAPVDVAQHGRHAIPENPAARAVFDLDLDPREHDNLLAHPSDSATLIASKMEAVLRAHAARPPGAVERMRLDRKTLERLRVLGYVE